MTNDPEFEAALAEFRADVARRERDRLATQLRERGVDEDEAQRMWQAGRDAASLEEGANEIRQEVIQAAAPIIASIPEHHVWVEYIEGGEADAVCVWCSVLRSEVGAEEEAA